MTQDKQDHNMHTERSNLTLKVKVKSLYLTLVVPSVPRLVSMEADGAPSTPPGSVSAPFYGYSKLWLHGSEESRRRR